MSTVQEDIERARTQGTQVETTASNQKIIDEIKKRNKDLLKRQEAAKKTLKSKKEFYDIYIKELATGKGILGDKQGKQLSKFELDQIRTVAEGVNKEILELNKLIAQKPEKLELPTTPKPGAVRAESLPSGFTQGQKPVVTETVVEKPADAKTPAKKKTPAKPAPTPTPTPTAVTDAQVFTAAQSAFGGIDEIFKTNDELKALLKKAIGDPNVTTDDYTESRFLSELQNTNWFKANAGPIRQRGFYKRQYDALTQGLKMDDPNYQTRINEINKTSEYGRGLENAVETVAEQWTQIYGTPTADDLVTIRTIATNLYDYANETDAVKIRNAVLTQPKKLTAGGIIGGKTGQNLTDLRAIAAANGLSLDKDFKNSIPTWLDRLSKGENIETIKATIRNAAKTTWNVSDRVSSLLDQGVDLDTIYAPYKTRMATILELSPETITFSDLAAKGVVGGKEEKNLFDFEKELRKDPRWQYTQNAREEVSNIALSVLRDFGFQG